MKAVNLLPAGQRPRRVGVVGARRTVAIAGALALLGGVGWWGHQVRQDLSVATEQLTAAETERAGLQAAVSSYRGVEQRTAALRQRRDAVVTLGTGRTDWERVIRDVATVLPRQAWITSLKAQTPNAGSAAAAGTGTPATDATGAQGAATAPTPVASEVGEGLHIEGFTYTQRQVATLMVRLGAVRGLGEPRLASAQAQVLGGRRVVRFVIDAAVDQRALDGAQDAASGGTP